MSLALEVPIIRMYSKPASMAEISGSKSRNGQYLPIQVIKGARKNDTRDVSEHEWILVGRFGYVVVTLRTQAHNIETRLGRFVTFHLVEER